VKPLVVTMEAFGPYPERQVLDFADLRGNTFFLITGPTGAGKTTVLDAMSFALYGDTSGGSESEGGRTGAAMRSDHARPETLTRVSFDFSLGEDLYRVERIPEQERPSRRGDGTTTQHQEATMWRLRRADDGRLSEHGAPLATGWSKVRAAAEDVLGFRGEQFRQVVMLPQGRFQQLLDADSGEREQILRALFDTGHYADIELALKDEAAGLREAARKVATQREEVLRQAETDDLDDLEERCARLALETTAATGYADEADVADEAARRALADGQHAARRLREQGEAAAEVERLACEADAAAARRAELEAGRRAAAVADVTRHAAEAEAAQEAARSAAAAAAAEAATAAGALAAARSALEAEDARAAERERAVAEAARLEGYVAGAAELSAAQASADEAAAASHALRTAAEAADAAWAAAHDALSRLDAAWREGQAGVLAARLADGTPCPVCGALDHPSPAALPAETPTQDEVEATRRAADAALAGRDAAQARLREADGALAAAGALAGDRRRALPQEFAEPRALDAARTAAERAVAELHGALQSAQTALHEADVAAATAQADAAAAQETLRRAEEVAVAASGLHATRLAEAGFPGEDDRAAAVRRPETLDELAALVTGHEQAALKASERQRLADEAAAGVETPDLELLERLASAATAAARSAREEAATLAAAAQSAEKQLRRLHELSDEGAGLQARYRTIGHLDDVANRRNPRSLSFQSYVLGAFLEDVLAAASQRLRLMTKSRYALERTEERTGRKRAAGLGLLAYDAWTGVSRPVATLSGGEKFMAALSLALGLAEVVQAHAGGIRLETVFVDEGFGSLDDESLDLAIGALMGLNEGGRLVGIISHVSELRERIDTRLEVTAGKSGSTARFVVP
jgi:exonuclease SbcC